VIFNSRQQAGKLLADRLTGIVGINAVVIGLARGGVIVAHEISSRLNLPLDVLVVKKISSQLDPELALGALAPDGVSYLDWKLAQSLGVDEDTLNSKLIPDIQKLIDNRLLLYKRGRKHLEVKGRTVILVDDGVATGATMQAAVKWTKKKKAKRIVVAVPVVPPDFVSAIINDIDDILVLDTPDDFRAVGQFYRNFPQIADGEVVQLLAVSHQSSAVR